MKNEKKKVKRTLARKIINTFIVAFVVIVFFILVFFGFSQTSTFRNFLKDNIVTKVNESINGNFYIKKIDGSIFTSIYLRESSLTVLDDTLFKAKNIEVKISPLQILLKKIYFRKIALEDLSISVKQNKKGEWNTNRLIKKMQEPETEEQPDSTSSPFMFTIQINAFEITNLNFVRQSYKNLNSQKIYAEINTDDFRLKDFNLSAKLSANVHSSIYQLIIDKISGTPNIKNLSLKNFSGAFEITGRYAKVSNLKLKTLRTDLSLDAFLGKINLLENINLIDFKTYPIYFKLNAEPVNFDDLSAFINGTDILKGNADLKLAVDGSFGNLNINELVLDYEKTHAEIKGTVANLNTPKKMFLDIDINNFSSQYETVNQLLPELNIPHYKNLNLSNFKLSFRGEPTTFHATIDGNIGKGRIIADTYIDVQTEDMRYDINFSLRNIDLFPVINKKSHLNGSGRIIGVGLDPDDLDAKLNADFFNSEIGNVIIDKLQIISNSTSDVIDVNLNGVINYSKVQLTGLLDFTENSAPQYDVSGKIDNFNLALLTENPDLFTDLNFKFNAEGQNLNIDSMNGIFNIDLGPSFYRDEKIDSAKLNLTLNIDKDNRSINLSSDFVDFNINGNFSLNRAIELLSYEASTISDIAQSKFEDLNPLMNESKEKPNVTEIKKIPSFVDSALTFNYDFKFKDFKLVAIILGDDKLDIAGSGDGSLVNDSTSFSITTNLNIDYLVERKKNAIFYISDFIAEVNFNRNNKSLSFDNLLGTISLSGSRVHSVGDFNNFTADLVFNQSKMFFNVAGEFNSNVKAEAEGGLKMSPSDQVLEVNNLLINYKNIEWENKDPISIHFASDSLTIKSFALFNRDAVLNVEGYLWGNGKQQITLKADSIPSWIINNYIFNSPESKFNSIVNLEGKINGSFDYPLIDLSLNINDISFEDINFGSLLCKFIYENKNLDTYMYFVDSQHTIYNPLLSVNSNLPLDLRFTDSDSRIIDDEKLSVNLKSSNFNLSAFGDLIPSITDQNGFINADINIGGTLNSLSFNGNFNLSDGSFRLLDNNLDYKLGLDLNFEGNKCSIDSLSISNNGGSKYVGHIIGGGEILFKGIKVDQADVYLNGDLALLSKKSKGVSPSLFGNLNIESDGNWVYSYKKGKSTLSAGILLKNTDVVFVPQKGSYQRSNRDFIYKILVDSSKLDKEELKFKRLVKEDLKTITISELKGSEDSPFDYDITVKIVDEAKLTFIFAQTVNQRLIVLATGELQFESTNGQATAQGAFDLLEGSRLEFFKALTATGRIRFETNITDPYLDIVASYVGEYIDPHDENATAEDVAVKIKLQGPVSELGTNLSENSGNIALYVGARNINNNIPDSQLDASDAISFIILNKFKKDLTAGDRTSFGEEAAKTATSLLGPVLTNVVNSEVGDIVNDIQLSSAGQYTRFRVSGKYQKFRYSFGGTKQVFQNIQNANLKIEYLFSPMFSMRVERRDPIIYSSSIEEKINELGLKYRFEF